MYGKIAVKVFELVMRLPAAAFSPLLTLESGIPIHPAIKKIEKKSHRR
jgi:hypothetical protein